MSQKLIKKLSYLNETTNLIKEALTQKGVSLDEKTPLRQVVHEINTLKTQKDTRYALFKKSPQKGEKFFLTKHFDTLETKNGSLTGAFNGYFSEVASTACFSYQNRLFLIKNSGSYNWNSYAIDWQNKIFTPFKRQSDSLIKGNILQNPTKKACLGGFYFKESDQDYPTGVISYPTGGVASSFSKDNMLWDSSGTYLINLTNKSTGVDVLKLIQNEDMSLHYQLVQTIDSTPLSQTNLTHAFAPAALLDHSFCLFGRYIYHIDPATDTLTQHDMGELPLFKDKIIVLYGKNFAVLKNSDTSQNTTLSFIKATPLDTTLAQTETAFYQNPSNYTFETFYEQTFQNVPSQPLRHANNGYFSATSETKDYFIRPLKDKITSIQDFEFCFEPKESSPVLGHFLDENTFIFQGTDELNCPCLYQKNQNTSLFEKEKAAFHLKPLLLTEYGYGTFNSRTYPKELNVQENHIDTSLISSGYGGASYDHFLKMGTHTCYTLTSDVFYGKTYLKNASSVKYHTSYCNQVNDEMISNLYSNALYKIEDNGSMTTYTALDQTTHKSFYSFVIERNNKLFCIDILGRGAEEHPAQMCEVFLNEKDKTFSFSEPQNIKSCLTQAIWNFAIKHKTKPILLTKRGYCYGFYEGADDGVLRFNEAPFPPQVQEQIELSAIKNIQTFYDGAVALQLNNGKTVHFFLDWDTSSPRPSVKEGTVVDVFDPILINEEKLNVYFSPFRRYQYVQSNAVYQVRLSPFYETCLSEKEASHHLENLSANLFERYPNASTVLATGREKTSHGAKLVEVEFG